MNQKDIQKAARQIRERCSQPVNINTNFTRGQIETLKRRFKPQYDVAVAMYPKVMDGVEFTDELVVRYAIFEVITSELHASFFRLTNESK